MGIGRYRGASYKCHKARSLLVISILKIEFFFYKL